MGRLTLKIFAVFTFVALLAACGGGSSSGSGSREFARTTIHPKLVKSKQLLATRAPQWNKFVDRYIDYAEVGHFNGVLISERKIVLTNEFVERAPLAYLASVWVHEAKHAEYRHSGCVHAQEQKVLPFQQQVFEMVGGEGIIVADHCL